MNSNVEYYTIAEVAIKLRVAYLTVYRWIQTHKLESVKAGKQYRIEKNTLESFITTYKNKQK